MDFRQIIAKWPNAGELARDLGVQRQLVKRWRQRDSIPAEYWLEMVAAAQGRGVADVTLYTLAEAAAFGWVDAEAKPEPLPPTKVNGDLAGLKIYGGSWKYHAEAAVPWVSSQLSNRSKDLLLQLADGVGRHTVNFQLRDLGCVWFGRASAHITPLGDLVAEHVRGLRGLPRKAERIRLHQNGVETKMPKYEFQTGYGSGSSAAGSSSAAVPGWKAGNR